MRTVVTPPHTSAHTSAHTSIGTEIDAEYGLQLDVPSPLSMTAYGVDPAVQCHVTVRPSPFGSAALTRRASGG